ncbi:MAG: hypothetical protein ACI89L_000286 [Phycisphaerales bacterium]|jgi:hypothetical protein
MPEDLPHASDRYRRKLARRRTLLRRTAYTLAIGTATLLAIYAVLYLRFNSRSPSITVDHAAELNALLPVLPAGVDPIATYEEAKHLWRDTVDAAEQAMKDNGEWPDDEDGDPMGYSIFAEIPQFTPDKPNYQTARDTLVAFRPTLDAMLADAKYPQTGFTLDTGLAGGNLQNALFINFRLDHLGTFRHSARLFAADHHIAAREGDADRALITLIGMYDLAAQMEPDPLLINSLVTIAMRNMADQVMTETLHHHPDLWDSEQLAKLASAAKPVSLDTARFAIESEHRIVQDLIQRVYTDDGNGSGKVTPMALTVGNGFMNLRGAPTEPSLTAKLLGPVISPFFYSRAQVTAICQQQIDAALDALEDPAKIDLIERDPGHDSATRQLKMLHLTDFSGIYAKYIDSAWHAKLKGDAARAVLAAHRYRAAHSEFPESLDRLVPEFLDAVPQDLLNPGAPLNYRRTDTGFVLYSVGSDADDDAGTPRDPDAPRSVLRRIGSFNERFDPNASPPDGDWILFPPEEN